MTATRFSTTDIEALQRRYPTGRHEVVVTDTGIAIDQWRVPPVEEFTVTLQPNSDWTLMDDAGGLIAKGSTVDEIVNAASV